MCVCPTGETACNGTCVNLLTSNANCGGCGLACSVGCNAGQCLVTLASGRTHPLHLAVDSTNVYFTDETGVWSVPIAGGSVSLVAPNPDAESIAQAGSYVYFITASDVFQAAKTGVGSPSMIAEAGGGGVATDTNNLYWGDYMGGAIYSIPLAGGSKALLSSAGEVATAASGVYWTGNAIMYAPFGSTMPTTFPSGQGAYGIAVDATTIYWSNQGTLSDSYADGSVASMSISGEDPITLAPMQVEPQDVVVDATSLYWVTDYGGTVMRLTPK
jgi:predicted secreted protein